MVGLGGICGVVVRGGVVCGVVGVVGVVGELVWGGMEWCDVVWHGVVWMPWVASYGPCGIQRDGDAPEPVEVSRTQ